MNEPFHPEPSEQELLASQFVDGATHPAAAGAAADAPDAGLGHGLAASFATVRGVLADAPPAADGAREPAISAALAVFDELHTEIGTDDNTDDNTVPAHAPAPVIHLASRRRWPNRMLAAAAAVVAIGVVGVAAFGGTDSDEASQAADVTAATERAEILVAGGGDDSAQADQFVASTIGAINGAADPVVAVNSPAQLGDFVQGRIASKATAPEAATADGDSSSDVGVNSVALQCLTGDQVFVADIIYGGTPAIAALDTVTGVTQAIDEQCNVLAEVAP